MKHIAPAMEFQFVADHFNLSGDSGQDGDRLAREREQLQRDQEHAHQHQPSLIIPHEIQPRG